MLPWYLNDDVSVNFITAFISFFFFFFFLILEFRNCSGQTGEITLHVKQIIPPVFQTYSSIHEWPPFSATKYSLWDTQPRDLGGGGTCSNVICMFYISWRPRCPKSFRQECQHGQFMSVPVGDTDAPAQFEKMLSHVLDLERILDNKNQQHGTQEIRKE